MRYGGTHLHGCAYAAGETMRAALDQSDAYLQAHKTHSLPPGICDPNGYPRVQGLQDYPGGQRQGCYSSSSEDSNSPEPLNGPTTRRPTSSHHSRKSSKYRSHGRGRRASAHRHRAEDEVDSDQEDSNLYCEPEFKYNPHHSGMNTAKEQFTGEKPSLPPRTFHYNKHRNHKNHLGNDISIEYYGRMPKRNTGYSMSRDSGVNCVGLTDASCLPHIERTPTTVTHGNVDVILNNGCHAKNNNPQATSTPRGDNNLKVHQATVHEPSKLAQDSGFSSPRLLDTEKSHKEPAKAKFSYYCRIAGAAAVRKARPCQAKVVRGFPLWDLNTSTTYSCPVTV